MFIHLLQKMLVTLVKFVLCAVHIITGFIYFIFFQRGNEPVTRFLIPLSLDCTVIPAFFTQVCSWNYKDTPEYCRSG